MGAPGRAPAEPVEVAWPVDAKAEFPLCGTQGAMRLPHGPWPQPGMALPSDQGLCWCLAPTAQAGCWRGPALSPQPGQAAGGVLPCPSPHLSYHVLGRFGQSVPCTPHAAPGAAASLPGAVMLPTHPSPNSAQHCSELILQLSGRRDAFTAISRLPVAARNRPVWSDKGLQCDLISRSTQHVPHLALPASACSPQRLFRSPLQHRPSPSPHGMGKPGGKGTLTELTLEPIGLPNLVDSDHWGATNFLQDVGQDFCFFWPEIMREKKKKYVKSKQLFCNMYQGKIRVRFQQLSQGH